MTDERRGELIGRILDSRAPMPENGTDEQRDETAAHRLNIMTRERLSDLSEEHLEELANALRRFAPHQGSA